MEGWQQARNGVLIPAIRWPERKHQTGVYPSGPPSHGGNPMLASHLGMGIRALVSWHPPSCSPPYTLNGHSWAPWPLKGYGMGSIWCQRGRE